jgi:hypothetical protein
MKTLPFTLSFFALVPQLAMAQVVKPPVVLERVRYSPALLIMVRMTIPRAGTTRFWGATYLKQQGKQVWVHVYDVQKIDFPARFDGEGYLPANSLQLPEDGMQKSGLDLWVENDKRAWEIVSRVRFEYLRNGNHDLYDLAHQFPYNRDNQKERLWLESNKAAFETVGVQTFWLDAKVRTKPIIEVGFQNADPKRREGERFLHLWVVFPEGLNKVPVIQRFYTKQFWLDSLSLDSISTDQTGNVLVKYHHNLHGKIIQSWTFKWKGNGFEPDVGAVR